MALYWVWIIALGALMGVVGQGLRIIVGLKKASDTAAALGQKFTDTIMPARLLISLLIGVLAGVMAAIVSLTPGAAISRETLLGLVAAGYSGADFIEGFMARYLPGGRYPPPGRFAADEPPSAAWPAAQPPARTTAAGPQSEPPASPRGG